MVSPKQLDTQQKSKNTKGRLSGWAERQRETNHYQYYKVHLVVSPERKNKLTGMETVLKNSKQLSEEMR